MINNDIDIPLFKEIQYAVNDLAWKAYYGGRFPHSELTHEETDLIVKLKENMLNMNEQDLDVRKYCEDIFEPNLKFEYANAKEASEITKYKQEIYNFVRFVFIDLKKIVDVMIKLLRLYFSYRKKFGKSAFKTLHDFE